MYFKLNIPSRTVLTLPLEPETNQPETFTTAWQLLLLNVSNENTAECLKLFTFVSFVSNPKVQHKLDLMRPLRNSSYLGCTYFHPFKEPKWPESVIYNNTLFPRHFHTTTFLRYLLFSWNVACYNNKLEATIVCYNWH